MDDKSIVGVQDRSRISSSEQYEVSYFAAKHGISAEDARRIIKQAGPSRERADAAADSIKRTGRGASH